MIYHIALYLQQFYSAFNVLHYVTFRSMAAFLTVVFISFVYGEKFISLSNQFFRSPARDYTPDTHKAKTGTPTMGGVFIIASSLATMLLWCKLTDPHVWLLIATLVGFGAVGLWDDASKIRFRKGISERKKFIAQFFLALIISCSWVFLVQPELTLCMPFFKNSCPFIGLALIPWVMFILIGTSNAVNLTDGLDGLAIGSLMLNYGVFACIAYCAGHVQVAHYLSIPYAQSSELTVAAMTLFGASLGFLWYNAHPAQIFMGDVGSLSLGAALGMIAILTRQELLLALSGGLFVIETLSVIMQIASVKLFKRKLFKMAPLHHHFELAGWPESKITVRFGIITMILCILALMCLKIR